MASKLGWILGLSAGVLLANNALANNIDVCDALGLSGLTISSDTNCLQIRGEVRYDFNWVGDGNGADCPAPKVCDTGTVLALSDDLLLSNFRVSLDPGAFFVAPQPYGLLETGAPVTTPAYEVNVGYSGFKMGAGIDATVNYGSFVPMDLGFDFEAGKVSGRGTGGQVDFANGLGVPSVGLVFGDFVGGAQSVTSTDITIDRTFAALDKHLNVPLFGGRHDFMGMDTSYTGYGILGTRFGGIGETQTTRIDTSAGTVNYDSQINGGYFGIYGGLGMDKTMPFGDDGLVLNGSVTATAGLDFHRYRVTDSVSGTFGALPASTNTFDVSGTVPVLKFGTDLSIGNRMWNFGVNAAVSSGRYPAFYIDRPISNQPATPGFNVLGGAAGEFSAYWRGRF